MGDNTKGFEFKKFATPRIIGGVVIVIIVLWALSTIFTSSEGPTYKNRAVGQHDSAVSSGHSADAGHGKTGLDDQPTASSSTAKGYAVATAQNAEKSSTAAHGAAGSHGTPVDRRSSSSHSTEMHNEATAKKNGPTAGHATPTHHASTATEEGTTTHAKTTSEQHGSTPAAQTDSHTPAARTAGSVDLQKPATHQRPAATTQHRAQASQSGHAAGGQPALPHGTTSGHGMPDTTAGAPMHKPAPKGVAFVEAVIQPMNYELEERWWGWRPNDIINLTDNVNNYQMGVLEVTRRTTVALAERISRTGTTDAFDENLEQAMNWFMIKASSYWFPSAESKYREGLEELEAYLEKLRAGNATFYTRTDNLIPLLASFEDLMGSCDENLVKQTNEDGTPLSAFAVDNYFFYTQGVASAMATVLEAVHHDFLMTLESRNATELLHHAIVSCQRARQLDPWIVLDRDLSSIFANHRANMAAPISHARFYLGQLIKTLST